jgi:hypothetical protein
MAKPSIVFAHGLWADGLSPADGYVTNSRAVSVRTSGVELVNRGFAQARGLRQVSS